MEEMNFWNNATQDLGRKEKTGRRESGIGRSLDILMINDDDSNNNNNNNKSKNNNYVTATNNKKFFVTFRS